MRNLEILQRYFDGTLTKEQMGAVLFPAPIVKSIPFTIKSYSPGFAEVECATDPEVHANPMGTVHGGVFCTIADAAMGVAHWVGLEEGESFTSIDFRINFFRPVWRDTLLATAKVVNAGRSVSYYDCAITRGDGKVVAQATSSIMTLRGDAAKGR